MTRVDIIKEKSIPQLIFLFSIPTILSLVLESLTSMVDTIFAGHLGTISTYALTAMGILNPILLILIAAQLIFGVSTSIVISKRCGENNKDKVNDTFKVGFYASFISSSIISLIIFIFQNQLLNILGAKGEVMILAKEYLNIAIIFNVFSSVGYMLLNCIRAFGYPMIEIIVVVLATIINIAFNIIFIIVFKMGIKGIALATLISEVFYFGFSIIFLIKKGLWKKNRKINIDEVKYILASLIKIGFVQFLMQSLSSISGFIINKVLIKYGDMSCIGAWSICSNINMIILLPLVGLTQGVQSVLAYFHGSKDEDNKSIVKFKVIKYSLVYSITLTILIYLLGDKIVNIFTNDMELINLSILIIKIIIVGFPFVGVVYTLITFMQVSEAETTASKLELIRQIVLLIPLVIFIPVVFSKYDIMNISPQLSVFFAIPMSTILLLPVYLKKAKSMPKELIKE